jgi:ATP-dependent protease HslVU (ClpYQ) peptidase subunit
MQIYKVRKGYKKVIFGGTGQVVIGRVRPKHTVMKFRDQNII